MVAKELASLEVDDHDLENLPAPDTPPENRPGEPASTDPKALPSTSDREREHRAYAGFPRALALLQMSVDTMKTSLSTINQLVEELGRQIGVMVETAAELASSPLDEEIDSQDDDPEGEDSDRLRSGDYDG